MQDISRLFARPEAVGSDATLGLADVTRYFVNSEGTRTVATARAATFRASVSMLADDGMPVRDAVALAERPEDSAAAGGTPGEDAADGRGPAPDAKRADRRRLQRPGAGGAGSRTDAGVAGVRVVLPRPGGRRIPTIRAARGCRRPASRRS
ncbi:MAG: hypothetical protein MZV70_19600 [Desulfobacterales bacterium]|nr:hypothetical protein [Desulfobacterales bacterium]